MVPVTSAEGSILATIESFQEYRDPELAKKLLVWQCDRLRNARYARLEQAGHPESRLALAQVFVDIEADANPPPEPEEREEPVSTLPPGIIAELLRSQPKPGLSEPPDTEPEGLADPGQGNAYLLIGGPGQGKSTVVQYLCQVHRAAMLEAAGEDISGSDRAIIQEVRKHTRRDKLPEPAQVCMPAVLSLPEFAAWMMNYVAESEHAVVDFLCEQIRKTLPAQQQSIPRDDMETLLGQIPWLLVFDGLDEVPAAGGRKPALKAIKRFVHTLRARRTPTILIATTRPQGYDQDLNDTFAPRYLLPLSRKRALHYALRLVQFRYRGHRDRQQKILERLKQACQEEATARLMTSPLQVTIMAALVDRIGRPPHQRWRLFRDYYQVIYEREMERPSSPAATLLRDYRAQIEEIHQHVALFLQVDSESQSGVDAMLTSAQLEQLIEDRLAQEEFSLDHRKELARQIREVATDRLVFLVSPREDHYGFELRSLQEFMAAEAAMSGSDDDVARRLEAIAHSHFWRNVFLFAAGKCFAERRHQRDEIIDICRKLNAKPGAPRGMTAGSYLALDLIEDGSIDAPKYMTQLAELAVRLIEVPPSNEHMRLAALGAMRDILERVLAEEWPSDMPEGTLDGRWLTLLGLIDTGVAWAKNLAERHWPDTVRDQGVVAGYAFEYRRQAISWISEKIAAHPDRFPPQFFRFLSHAAAIIEGLFQAIHGIATTPLPGLRQKQDLMWFPLRQDGEAVHSTAIRKTTWTPPIEAEALRKALETRDDVPASWRPWLASLRLYEQPSAEALSRTLEHLAADFDRDNLAWWSSHVPWTLGAFLSIAESPETLMSLAQDVRNGKFGDYAEWQAMEQRWQEGILLDDLLATAEEWPFLERVLVAVKPVQVPDAGDTLLDLLDRYHGADRIRARRLLSHLMVPLLAAVHADTDDDAFELLEDKLTPDLIEALAKEAQNPLLMLQLAFDGMLEEAPGVRQSWLEAAERWSLEQNNIAHWLSLEVGEDAFEYLLARYQADHSRPGLLRMLSRLLALKFSFEMDGPLLELSLPADPSMRFDFELARWAQGRASSDEIEAWLQDLGTASEQEPQRIQQLGWLLHQISISDEPVEQRRRYLDILRAGTPADAGDDLRALHFADYVLWGSQPSGLGDTATWYQLGLNAPAPAELLDPRRIAPRDTVATPAHELGSSPMIQGVQIRGIRVFETAELQFALPRRQERTGGWVVFLGENGVGKSTLLRSLVLALAEPEIAQSLIVNARAPLLRTGMSEGEVTVTIDGVPFSSRVLREGDRERVVPDRNNAPRPMVFAYGCSRGSAVGGTDREVSHAPVDRVITLFDETKTVISAETWLKLLRLNAFTHQGPHTAIYETTIETLRRMLPGVEAIDVDGDGVWFSGASVGTRTPLTGLSDGYITTVGWVTDMLARWLHRADKLGEPIVAGFNEHMRGLVLVDEIDLHLHPRWQRDVISTVRRAFPQMSFVVTTHNPLTLLGARRGEIVVLRRDHASGEITANQMDLPEGIRADQVLTGEWFGLASTLDPETIKLLEEHRRLLRDKVPPSSPERQRVDTELTRRLDGFPGTTIEQLTRQVAAEVIAESYPEQSNEEKMVARAKLKALVNQRLQQQPKS